jgi:hypothetical protein
MAAKGLLWVGKEGLETDARHAAERALGESVTRKYEDLPVDNSRKSPKAIHIPLPQEVVPVQLVPVE